MYAPWPDNEDMVRQLFLTLGPDYVSIIIAPALASSVRGLTSEAEAKAITPRLARVLMVGVPPQKGARFGSPSQAAKST